MFIINAVKFGCCCFAVWAVSTLFFAFLEYFWPGLDVAAGARAMTAMFAFCAGTALAVEAAERKNL